ncbi:hypothetical protein EZV62_015914 [Acer yangbiense]|uniref:non-specific serine/threonine protein kinase n=1 Tax=Acer yangbiense TaxID=1000413 RepID=A0A5C7HMY8_9ROSI|nr:hypothetical protein EZV62_015914 [Acer yangbiense]
MPFKIADPYWPRSVWIITNSATLLQRPNLGGNGFLQSVTAAVWRTCPPGDARLPPPSANKNKNDDASTKPDPPPTDSKNSGAPNPIQSTPPSPVQINNNNDVSKQPPPPSQQDENNNNRASEDPDKSKKPTHIKRVSNVELQMESVLGRKTGNMKEIYSLGRKLGHGQFGTTFLYIEKGKGKEFDCKSIAKRKLTTAEDVEDVRREIRIMHHLAGHPNVIQIVDAYKDVVAVHVMMELCVGGELFDRIIQRGHYTERKVAELTRLIVGVVEACHSLGVMHRGLKPENFYSSTTTRILRLRLLISV